MILLPGTFFSDESIGVKRDYECYLLSKFADFKVSISSIETTVMSYLMHPSYHLTFDSSCAHFEQF